MRWFKRSADTPHLKRLSPLKNDEEEGSMYGGDVDGAEIVSRNEFLSSTLVSAAQADADRRNSRKDTRRDWRRSYNKNAVNCYNIQEGKVINKSRDRSLSPSLLKRKKSNSGDFSIICEKQTKEYLSASRELLPNNRKTKYNYTMANERRNPLTTTRLSFCDTKLNYDEKTDTFILVKDTNELDCSQDTSKYDKQTEKAGHSIPSGYSVKNERNIKDTKDYDTISLRTRSKSVEDFPKESIHKSHKFRTLKPENKFKLLSGKTQKFFINFYKSRPEKSGIYEKLPDEINKNNQFELLSDFNNAENLKVRNRKSFYSESFGKNDFHLLNDTTDTDSGILENDSGQSSLNSIVISDVNFDKSKKISSNLKSKEFALCVECHDLENFNNLFHCNGSYFITNSLAKKIKPSEGLLQPGDEVLEISGFRIRGINIIEIHNLLANMKLGNDCGVKLVLRRTEDIKNNFINNGRDCILPQYGNEVENDDKALDFAATAIKIDGKLQNTKKSDLSKENCDKTQSALFHKNASNYGSITRRLIRRSLLGRLAASSVIDVSNGIGDQLMETSKISNPIETNTVHSSKHSIQPSQGNFYTLPRKAKIGLYTFHTISFEKGIGKKSLGFTIVGGRDSPKGAIGIFVKRILATGQAAELGLLKVGDEILSVNGEICHDLSHEEAVKLFKGIRSGKIVLRVCRRQKQKELLSGS